VLQLFSFFAKKPVYSKVDLEKSKLHLETTGFVESVLS
jgi:hypothetical protein